LAPLLVLAAIAFVAGSSCVTVATPDTDGERIGRFHESFDADGGEGLGADAQAGWTALVANLIVEGWPAD
jgi:hypothetical protein